MSFLKLHGLVPRRTRKARHGPIHDLVDCGAVFAIVSNYAGSNEFASLPPDAIAAWALEHNDILLGYCAHGPVLPMAVGAVFSDATAVRQGLDPDLDAYQAALDQLTDLREFTIQLRRTTAPQSAPDATADGKAFLRARQAKRDARKNLASKQRSFVQTLAEHAQGIAAQMTHPQTPHPEKAFECSVLMHISAIDDLRSLAQTQDIPATDIGFDLQISGPWPPYSFIPHHINGTQAG